MNKYKWSPEWAKHVIGRYEEREFTEDGLPEPQRVEVTCTTCGTVWKTVCTSGAVRSHIQRFAFVHAHRDPFKEKSRG